MIVGRLLIAFAKPLYGLSGISSFSAKPVHRTTG
jgi:hypothetical protein